MALQVFEKATAKIESSRGAGGTPVRILSFSELTHSQTIATIRPEEYRGSYFGFYQAVAGTEQNTVTMSGNLDYSTAAWLGYVFVSGAPTLGTPVAGTAFSYTFTPSGSSDDLKTLSLEAGYSDTVASTAAVRLTYLGGNELTLNWNKADSTVTYNAGLLSASTATKLTAFTGSPASPTTTLLSTSTTQVYIDASTIGNTADNQVLTADFTLSNGWQALYTLNGSTGAQAVYRPNHRTWQLQITRYFANSNEWDVYGTKAERKIRIKTTGNALGTATYTLQLDCYGVLTGREVAEADGLAVETLTYEPFYDTSATTDFALTVTSADASIT